MPSALGRADAPGEDTRPSLAVLPFTNLSADPENEFFADGMTEEILNALARAPGLRVAGRASSFSLKGRSQDLRSIGELLRVRTVLEGSVRRLGNRVRITAQLSDAAEGYQLWSERYDREIEDVFALQDEIATAIATRLEATLREEDPGRAQRAPASIAAYDPYLKGRALLYRRGGGLAEGMALMRRALELDPEYALAWAGLADAHSLLGYYGVVPPETCAGAAREAAAMAMRHGPDLAESHNAVAQVSLLFDWDWDRTEWSFRRALQLDPGYTQAAAWYSLFFLGFVRGEWPRAIARLEALQRSEPLSAYVASTLAYALGEAGRSHEGLAWAHRAYELDAAAYLSNWVLQLVLAQDGQYEASLAAAHTALALANRASGALLTMVVAQVALGRRDEALAVRRELEARAAREHVSPMVRAEVAATLGDGAAAAALLHEAVARRDPTVVTFAQARLGTALKALPEYQALITALRLPRGAAANGPSQT
jgi:TolB-like protein